MTGHFARGWGYLRSPCYAPLGYMEFMQELCKATSSSGALEEVHRARLASAPFFKVPHAERHRFHVARIDLPCVMGSRPPPTTKRAPLPQMGTKRLLTEGLFSPILLHVVGRHYPH